MAQEPIKRIQSLFPQHKDCEWMAVPGTRQRMFRGEVFDVLFFKDADCTILESMPLDHSGENVAIADSLRKSMGWAKGRFLFAGTWFFRQETVEDLPEVGTYLPAAFYMNEYGFCNFADSGAK